MAYTNPNGKEFKDKSSAVRYYFAQGKTPEKVAELSGVELRNVKLGLKTMEAKGITAEMVDAKGGELKAQVEKRKTAEKSTEDKARVKAEKASNAGKEDTSKNEQATDAANKTSETKSAVAKKKAKAK